VLTVIYEEHLLPSSTFGGEGAKGADEQRQEKRLKPMKDAKIKPGGERGKKTQGLRNFIV